MKNSLKTYKRFSGADHQAFFVSSKLKDIISKDHKIDLISNKQCFINSKWLFAENDGYRKEKNYLQKVQVLSLSQYLTFLFLVK